MTLDVFRYEGEQRITAALGLSAAFALMGLAFVATAPLVTSDVATSAQFEQLTTQLPQPFVQAFGLESLSSAEGLLAGEFYTLFWSLFFGIYLAYTAAGSIADDVETDRMDVLLSAPVSRGTVVFEKFLALLVPIVAASVVTPTVISLAAWYIDVTVPLAELAVLHALSIPYLLCCGAIGLALSVFLDDADTARNAAIGLLFALYLFQSFVPVTDVGWLANVAPMAHFDPNEVLLDGVYDVAGAALLLAATIVLLILSRHRFVRMDIR